ncbi:MAG: HNH endonuclease [Chromatiaceae bacterium]|nr:HNH endonuclease [Chromatiaceae bacterium]
MNSVRLPLSGGIAFVLVDPDTHEWASRHTWHMANGYPRRSKRINGKVKNFYLHREIIGAAPGQMVDHVNRNPIDCRKANLRLVTPTQNNMNQSANKHKRHGVFFKGVYKNRKGSTYSVKLCGKHLGNFKTEIEAAKAYNLAAKSAFGDYAHLNPV